MVSTTVVESGFVVASRLVVESRLVVASRLALRWSAQRSQPSHRGPKGKPVRRFWGRFAAQRRASLLATRECANHREW